jgi:hypothetical protein
LSAPELRLDPGFGRIVHQVLDGEHRAVDLVDRLQGVAAVDEQGGTVAQDHRDAGRAAEPGEPGQPFVARRHVLVLLAVGARDEEAVDPAMGKLRAQGGHPRRNGRALAGVVERLETGLEHGGQSIGRWAVAATGGRGFPMPRRAACRICVQCNMGTKDNVAGRRCGVIK